MKKDKVWSFLIVISLIGLSPAIAWAQFPFYDIELEPVCADSSGELTTLYSAQLYVLGRNGFDVVYQYYFDETGNKVVPGGGVTISAGPCWEQVTEDTTSQITFESAFSISDYTIPADTYDYISIVNLGGTTHLITFPGGQMRMLPGETYFFRSHYDAFYRKRMRNPTIVISQGVAGINNLRVYAEAK
jgi:hypothetical protein